MLSWIMTILGREMAVAYGLIDQVIISLSRADPPSISTKSHSWNPEMTHVRQVGKWY